MDGAVDKVEGAREAGVIEAANRNHIVFVTNQTARRLKTDAWLFLSYSPCFIRKHIILVYQCA